MKILPTIGPATEKTKDLKYLLTSSKRAFLYSINFSEPGRALAYSFLNVVNS